MKILDGDLNCLSVFWFTKMESAETVSHVVRDPFLMFVLQSPNVIDRCLFPTLISGCICTTYAELAISSLASPSPDHEGDLWAATGTDRQDWQEQTQAWKLAVGTSTVGQLFIYHVDQMTFSASHSKRDASFVLQNVLCECGKLLRGHSKISKKNFTIVKFNHMPLGIFMYVRICLSVCLSFFVVLFSAAAFHGE